MLKIAKGVAADTGLQVGQILDRWMLTRRKHASGPTMWNTYAQYFKLNHDAEISRITQGVFIFVQTP